MPPKLDFEFPKAKILARLHKILVDNEKVNPTIEWLADRLSIQEVKAKLALAQLEDDVLSRVVTKETWDEHPATGLLEKFEEKHVEITMNGIAQVEEWSDEYYSKVISNEFEVNSAEQVEPKDVWEPLPLERGGPKYEHALETVEAALSEISGNNGYAKDSPEERGRIVWSISEGLKHLKDGFPGRDQIFSMLIKPLKFISEKFAVAAMGEAAKAAVKALLNWLGLP